MGPLPRFLHALTAVHAAGACACFVMAIGSAASDNFRASLAVSGGSAIMVASFREWTWVFLLFVGAVLATLALSSWLVRPWAWPMTLVVYGIGVFGSLWQVSVGIPQGWVRSASTRRSFSTQALQVYVAPIQGADLCPLGDADDSQLACKRIGCQAIHP